MRRATTGWLLVLLLLAAPARAGEDEAPPAPAPAPAALPAGHAEALAAWRWLEAAQSFRNGLLAQVRILREADPDQERKATWQQAFRAALDAGRPVLEAAETGFREAFAASDVDAWDVKAHADLLEAGLDMVARHALETDPARAVTTWDRLIALLPESAAARRAKTTWLPIALPSTGDFAGAGARLATLAEEAEDVQRPALWQALGDVLALAGDTAGARAQYERALAGIPTEPESGDPRARLRPYLEVRLKLVGQPAPELGEATWLGGAARRLADLHGRVVLLDYWATW